MSQLEMRAARTDDHLGSARANLDGPPCSTLPSAVHLERRLRILRNAPRHRLGDDAQRDHSPKEDRGGLFNDGPKVAPLNAHARSGGLSSNQAERNRGQRPRCPPTAHVRPAMDYPCDMPPTLANGKICYIEIPAVDIQRSAAFYSTVFGWRIRRRGDGSTAFDDTTGEVSGTWVLGRPPATQPGLLLYVMVDSVARAVDAVGANGGEIAQPIGLDAPEITARFRDPAGNVIGLYQQPA